MTKQPAFYAMSLHELAQWVLANNAGNFDEFPGTDDLDDEEEVEVFNEYEAMAEELWALQGASA